MSKTQNLNKFLITSQEESNQNVLLNKTLHKVLVSSLGESYINRKGTAQIFLKKNEKDNILAKTRSINYNLKQIRSKLDIRSQVIFNSQQKNHQNRSISIDFLKKNEEKCHENNENYDVNESDTEKYSIKDRIYKKKLKSLMFSNELWSDKHYQQVINDSFLMPKIELLIISFVN